jgi:nitroreductase
VAELSELLTRRRMVRNYEERQPDGTVIERVLDQARRAPSAGHSQAVSFVVISEPSIRLRIAELAGEPEYVRRGFPSWLSRAPVHVVLAVEPATYHARYADADKASARSSHQWDVPYWYVDAGATLMLLLLAAADAGLAAGFQGSHNLPGLSALLAIPDSVAPIGLVTLGYAAPDRPSGSLRRGRKPLEQIVHRERW